MHLYSVVPVFGFAWPCMMLYYGAGSAFRQQQCFMQPLPLGTNEIRPLISGFSR